MQSYANHEHFLEQYHLLSIDIIGIVCLILLDIKYLMRLEFLLAVSVKQEGNLVSVMMTADNTMLDAKISPSKVVH